MIRQWYTLWFFLLVTVCALTGPDGVTSFSIMTDNVVVLQTARLVLRQFTLDDVPLLVELDSDPEVMKYISHGKPTPASVIEEKVLPEWLRYYDNNNNKDNHNAHHDQLLMGFWAAHHAENDHEFIGWFHLRPDRLCPEEELELGYRLKRSVWGRGYATEMSRALIRQSRRQHNKKKIVGRTLVGNGASIAVMKKCDLQFEGFFEYSSSVLPDWSPEERRAVKYSI